MKFKIDKNLPAECAAILREEGFDADTVGDEDLSGCSDPTVFGVCQHESRVLVTLDLDFSNVTAYPPSTHCGIVVIRSKAQDKLTLMGPVLKRQSPGAQLWIVEHDRIRFRRDADS